MGGDVQRLGKGYFPFLAFLGGILGVAELMLVETQLVFLFGVIGDGGDFAEDVGQAGVPEPVKGVDLAFDQVGDVQHLGDLGVSAGLRQAPVFTGMAGMPVAVGDADRGQSHTLNLLTGNCGDKTGQAGLWAGGHAIRLRLGGNGWQTGRGTDGWGLGVEALVLSIYQ